MSPVEIRHLEPRDIAQVHALYAEPLAFANTLQLPYQVARKWEDKLLQAQPGITSLVAVRGDEVLGQLTLENFQHPRRRHVATLGMGVKAAARGTGVGSLLLQAAIDTCERWLNVTRMEIEVYVDNTAALALYQKHGFVIEGTCRDYAFRDGKMVDVHVMARITLSAQATRPPPPGQTPPHPSR